MPRPVPRQQLVEWFCAPRCGKGDRKNGAEFEFIVTDLQTRREAPFDGPRGLESVLRRFLERGKGWKAVEEDGRLIALDHHDGAALTLEPGSQLELATVPRVSVREIDADLRAFVREFHVVTEGLEVALLGIGLNPFSSTSEVALGPKRRYAIMTDYLSRRGALALDMMRRTGSVHCSFDYKSEDEAVEMTRLAYAVAPIVTAVFAHSPIEKVAPNGHVSFRGRIWRETDPDRCGTMFEALRPDFDFERYLDKILRLPLIFTLKDGVYRPAHGLPAGKWFAGEWDGLEGHEGLEPVPGDLEWVINQSFRDARLRRYVECRAADFPPAAMASAPVAFYAGLLYDDETRRAAWQRLSGYTDAERDALSAAVPREGLRARLRNDSALDLARELAALSRGGLDARGLGESALLEPIDELLAEGITPAERLLRGWTPGDADGLIERLRFPADP